MLCIVLFVYRSGMSNEQIWGLRAAYKSKLFFTTSMRELYKIPSNDVPCELLIPFG